MYFVALPSKPVLTVSTTNSKTNDNITLACTFSGAPSDAAPLRYILKKLDRLDGRGGLIIGSQSEPVFHWTTSHEELVHIVCRVDGKGYESPTSEPLTISFEGGYFVL